jgi:hypothetical protein
MTREAIPLILPDVAVFTRSLGRALEARHAERPAPPGHVELLNLIARAAGQRSYQALRASARLPAAAAALDAAPAAPALTPAARKALSQFDAKRVYTEREVNEILKLWHTWGDHVTLRRELINHQLLTRKSDGSQYRKLPTRPDDEVRWLLRAWRERLRQNA